MQTCTNCRRADQGPLSYAYLAWYEGKQRIGQRLRLCEGCWVAVLGDAVLCADTSDSQGHWWTQEERADLSPAAVAGLAAVRTTSSATKRKNT